MPEVPIKLTKAAIDRLPVPPEGCRKFYYDSEVKGLAVLVMPNGQRSFYVYKWASGKPCKKKLGVYPVMTIEQARRRALEVATQIAQGEDPNEADRLARAEWTFGSLFDWYVEQYAKVRNKTWQRDIARFDRHLGALKAIKLSSITRPMVRQIHMSIAQSLSGRYEANRVLALVRAVFNKAIAHELVAGPNPAAGVEMHRERT